MRFALYPSRVKKESIIPMVNVIFLLLIFFLMTSSFIIPDPFELDKPYADSSNKVSTEERLYISKTGKVFISDKVNENAWRYLEQSTPEKLLLIADSSFPAKDLLNISEKLKELGIIELNLLINQRIEK